MVGRKLLTMTECPSCRSSMNLLLLSSIGLSLYPVYLTCTHTHIFVSGAHALSRRMQTSVQLTSTSCDSFLNNSSVSYLFFWSGTTRGMAAGCRCAAGFNEALASKQTDTNQVGVVVGVATEIMGGGGSKQAQLERYGQLLSPRERHAVETTFTDIAGSPDASFLTQQQLNVGYCTCCSQH